LNGNSGPRGGATAAGGDATAGHARARPTSARKATRALGNVFVIVRDSFVAALPSTLILLISFFLVFLIIIFILLRHSFRNTTDS
jgi:hypothetical protein